MVIGGSGGMVMEVDPELNSVDSLRRSRGREEPRCWQACRHPGTTDGEGGDRSQGANGELMPAGLSTCGRRARSSSTFNQPPIPAVCHCHINVKSASGCWLGTQSHRCV
ncbi:hypothetical protein Q8A67_018625 [Cirrhinus molitorella]|uniref:Uncharacterized protein n=1 Tax=Cirrhinus molitorella TaxID=172907 RepID=A0AA88P9I4_9TELE|nr:hypothetical protein Q8A67_018625 [Cirrhinus molitorella]